MKHDSIASGRKETSGWRSHGQTRDAKPAPDEGQSPRGHLIFQTATGRKVFPEEP